MWGLGTDPEFFIRNRLTGAPVPAHRFFDDKHNKRDFDYGRAFRDGYGVEINLLRSLSCRETLAHHVGRCISAVRDIIGPANELISVPAVRINLCDMDDAPPDVREFGCEPSVCAYKGEYKVPAINAMKHEWRYSGGHMHLSIDPDRTPPVWFTDPQAVRLFVKMLDLFLGVPLTCLFGGELSNQRRKYYGQAGEFRLQNYPNKSIGVEYRTPGPEIFNAPPIASFAFGVLRAVARSYDALTTLWDPSLEGDIQHAVNTGEGVWSLLQEVPNYYSPKTIEAVHKRGDFRELYVPPDYSYHHGWWNYHGQTWPGLGYPGVFKRPNRK